MIIYKYYNGNENLIYRYSDKGVKIKQNETGVMYDGAVDVITTSYTYSETDEPIEKGDEEE